MKFIPLFIICLTACLLCIDTTNRLSFHWLTTPILTAFLFSWPTTYLPHRVRGIVQFLIGVFVVIVCLVDCYCQEYFSTVITPQILSNVILSDARESHEFFSTFIGFHVFSNWRITALIVLSITLPVVFSYLYIPICKKKTKYIGSVILCICLICEIPATYRYSQLFFIHDDLQMMEGLVFRHFHDELSTPVHRLAFSYYSLRQSSHALEKIKRSTFSAKIDNCSYQSSHIVLVIGDVFKDVVTPWNITCNVFLDVFSLYEYGMNEEKSEMPLFPILFRRAGYSVNFFSNQFLLRGLRKGATTHTGHFFLTDKEMSDSIFTYRNMKSSKFDLGLVKQINNHRMELNGENNTLDIIHLIGQHFNYSMRYPESESKFHENDYANRNIDIDAKHILMQYDNATYYNDMVLDSILSIYKYEDAIIVFVADHGEEVYDDNRTYGRLFQEPTALQARYEFEVPMWIWCSEKYRQCHPNVISHIKQAVNKPFMIDGLPQLLLSLAGISCPWNDERRNLLSPNYQCKKRIITGDKDYDKLISSEKY